MKNRGIAPGDFVNPGWTNFSPMISKVDSERYERVRDRFVDCDDCYGIVVSVVKAYPRIHNSATIALILAPSMIGWALSSKIKISHSL